MQKLNVTDGHTDGGIAISPVPGPTAPAGDNKVQIGAILTSRQYILYQLVTGFTVHVMRGHL